MDNEHCDKPITCSYVIPCFISNKITKKCEGNNSITQQFVCTTKVPFQAHVGRMDRYSCQVIVSPLSGYQMSKGTR